MHIAISNELLLVIGVVVSLWLLSRTVLVPRARRSVLSAHDSSVAGKAVTLAITSTIATILGAFVTATAIVAIGAIALDWYLSSVPSEGSFAAVVSQLRSYVEQGVDLVAEGSASIWIASLCMLALVWLLVSRSSSRRRWSDALEARRSALRSALSGLSDDELAQKAKELNEAGVQALETRLEGVKTSNLERIKKLMAEPVLRFGSDSSTTASMGDILGIAQHMREEADKLEAEAGDQEKISGLRENAAGLLSKFDEIARELSVNLDGFDGNQVALSLARALTLTDDDLGWSAARQSALRDLIVAAQIDQHAALGSSKARAEPELLREWIASFAAGEGAVNTTSFIGRMAAKVALIALFLGTVGLGVKQVGPLLISQASALQLQLAALSDSRDLSEAVKTAPPPLPVREQAPNQLASDDATVQALHQAFRSAVVHSLRQSTLASGSDAARAVRTAVRDHFELGAMDARQRILAASGRTAAPPLEPGRTGYVYASSGGAGGDAIHVHPTPPSGNVITVLDETIDRRIQMLRQNEGVWQRLRAAAATPARPDLVGDAFLRTAFGNTEVASSHAFRQWMDHASYQFASQTARTGRLPRPGDIVVPAFGEHPMLSVRDRRLIADFKAEAPQRIASIIDDAHAGRVDPGSLHRALPGARPTVGGGGVNNLYSELFPATHAPPPGSAPGYSGGGGGGGGFGGGAGGGGGGGSRASAPHGSGGATRVASARSFSHVRFSGRVGGVLIGVAPTAGGEALDIRDVSWRIDGNALRITLVDAAGARTVLGPFHPAIAHHAMAYAADGRVVTSTLPQPTRSRSDDLELEARRVLVHPAFEDTAFACRTIQVDRFVDAFTNPDLNSANESLNRVRHAVTLLGRLVVFAREAPSQLSTIPDVDKVLEPLAQHARSCGTGDKCFPIEPYTSYGFDFGNASSFLGCLQKAAGSRSGSCIPTLQAFAPMKGSSGTWLVDSGVREVPFKLDKRLAFLTGEETKGDPLWPLDFMIQAVPQTLNGDDVSVGDGWEPWRFPTIDRAIKEQVLRGVLQSPQATAVLADMRSFTVLQRLFRLALAGELGVSFPLDSLVDLQKRTAEFVKVERSERWNVNMPLMRTMMSQHEYLKDRVGELVRSPSASPACKSAAQTALTAAEGSDWPKGEGLWRSINGVERACQDTYAATQIRQRLEVLRRNDLVDEAISIARDRGSANEAFACRPL